MMGRKTTGSIATLVLAAIGALHIYWARGGQRFAAKAIPTSGGKPTMAPGATATYAVAGLLATAASASALSTMHLGGRLPRLLAACAGLTLLLRAVGDFRLIGFLKKERSSEFAKLDTALYSPLCLFLGLALLRSAK